MFVYCHLELVAADVPELAREFHRRFASDHELAHGEETIALAGLASPAHLRSDPTALKLKQNRMPVRCCQYTFDLLVKYLHVANQMALLSILNKHVAVTVTDGDPAPEADEDASFAPTPRRCAVDHHRHRPALVRGRVQRQEDGALGRAGAVRGGAGDG